MIKVDTSFGKKASRSKEYESHMAETKKTKKAGSSLPSAGYASSK